MMFESLSKLRELDRRVNGNDKALVRMEKLLGLPPVPPMGEIVVDGSKRRSLHANLVARLNQNDERIERIGKTIKERKLRHPLRSGELKALYYSKEEE